MSKSILPIVAIDTNVVAWGLRDNDESGEKAKQAALLLRQLQDRKAIVIIPSIVLSEVLIQVESSQRNAFASAISDGFLIADFNIKAAILAAKLYELKRNTVVKNRPGERRAFKADTMILASAKNAGAQEFYTDDNQCRKLAEVLKMEGRELPEFDENLFINLPE